MKWKATASPFGQWRTSPPPLEQERRRISRTCMEYGGTPEAYTSILCVYIYPQINTSHDVLIDALQHTANETSCLAHDVVLRWGYTDLAENPSGTDPPWRPWRAIPRSYVVTLTPDVQSIWRYGSASMEHAQIICVIRIFDGETCADVQMIWIPDREVCTRLLEDKYRRSGRVTKLSADTGYHSRCTGSASVACAMLSKDQKYICSDPTHVSHVYHVCHVSKVSGDDNPIMA